MAVLLLVWIVSTSAIVASGLIERYPMPGLPLFFGTVLGTAILAGFSRIGDWVMAGASFQFLVRFQAFRLPLELVLHVWSLQGVIPSTMSWSTAEGGHNFDIVSGILALLVSSSARMTRRAAGIFNLIGLGLLLNVGRVAMLSSPVPFGWEVEPKLQLAFHWPFALIGPVCVWGALFGHVVLLRKLLATKSHD
jgi:hypothetical protein